MNVTFVIGFSTFMVFDFLCLVYTMILINIKRPGEHNEYIKTCVGVLETCKWFKLNSHPEDRRHSKDYIKKSNPKESNKPLNKLLNP